MGLQREAVSPSEFSMVIDSLKKKVEADRRAYIMKRMEENRNKLAEVTNHHHKLSLERIKLRASDAGQIVDLLTKRQKDAIDMQNGVNASNGDSDSTSSQEDGHASAVLLGSSIAVKNAVRPIKLPEARKLPPYTTWIFLDRNQRMTEDQSVVGRRRIYYDQNGGEALIASDSEEEAIDEEEEKKEFVESEDYIIRMTIQQLGSSVDVLDLLAQQLSRKPPEIMARYEVLVNRENAVKGSNTGNSEFDMSSLYDKDLEAALDSFDNLFCRRCLVFDCKLHGCSQDLIFPAEKQCTLTRMDEEKAPCGPHCYRQAQKVEGNTAPSSTQLKSEQKAIPFSDSNNVQSIRKKPQLNSEQKSIPLSDGNDVQSTKKKPQLDSEQKAIPLSDSNNVQSSRKKARRRPVGYRPSRLKSLQSEIASSNSENSEPDARPGPCKSKLNQKRGTRPRVSEIASLNAKNLSESSESSESDAMPVPRKSKLNQKRGTRLRVGESASLNAKNLSESSESDAMPVPRKSKLNQKRGARPRVSEIAPLNAKNMSESSQSSESDAMPVPRKSKLNQKRGTRQRVTEILPLNAKNLSESSESDAMPVPPKSKLNQKRGARLRVSEIAPLNVKNLSESSQSSESDAMPVPRKSKLNQKHGTRLRVGEIPPLNAKNLSESSGSSESDANPVPHKNKLLEKRGTRRRFNKRKRHYVMPALKKRQKKLDASDSDSFSSGLKRDMGIQSGSHKESEEASSSSLKAKSSSGRRGRRNESLVSSGDRSLQPEVPDCKEITSNQLVIKVDEKLKTEEFGDESICRQEMLEFRSWKTIEKSLFEKGLEIFGRNSCLIARNLMNGLKTCAEVFYAMNCSENKLSSQGGDSTDFTGDGSRIDCNGNTGGALKRRSRFLRRRGRVRRLKYSWKSAGYHSMRKRISDKKELPCRQYNPCGCQTTCGKDCSCFVSGTCCEKYCGCPKTCKTRFRGCHCAKSQCRSRQCPCFAAGRECDPDVCRNCWIGCGDGTLGIPSQRGDNYECRNMKLLLKQQQQVLLGRSDVSGWGAFLKNSVPKHEYLGEYTGELISHREADKRGKIYDRENSSFLFNLNDQYVLDAYRKGDKLKFANHSPVPNCYAKVIMVAGDHRVGIFAKERICAGEELFYDYRYEPDRAPAWAKKPETPGSKKDDAAPSSGHAKKLA